MQEKKSRKFEILWVWSFIVVVLLVDFANVCEKEQHKQQKLQKNQSKQHSLEVVPKYKDYDTIPEDGEFQYHVYFSLSLSLAYHIQVFGISGKHFEFKKLH